MMMHVLATHATGERIVLLAAETRNLRFNRVVGWPTFSEGGGAMMDHGPRVAGRNLSNANPHRVPHV
jgi:hypothetical protein